MRSASWSASSKYWVVNITVVPSLFRRRTSSHSEIRLIGSRPVVGSSRNNTVGWWMSARARSKRLRIPPEYVPTRRSAAAVRPTRSSKSFARAFILLAGIPYNTACNRKSSVPVMSGSIAASCSATPIRRRTSSGFFATSKPATIALPEVGRSNVVSMRTTVLFPAPFGPRKPKISPALTVRLMPFTALTSPK